MSVAIYTLFHVFFSECRTTHTTHTPQTPHAHTQHNGHRERDRERQREDEERREDGREEKREEENGEEMKRDRDPSDELSHNDSEKNSFGRIIRSTVQNLSRVFNYLHDSNPIVRAAGINSDIFFGPHSTR